jgi:hypothetical protein
MLEAEAALQALLTDEVRLRKLTVVAPASDQVQGSVCAQPHLFCTHAGCLLYLCTASSGLSQFSLERRGTA